MHRDLDTARIMARAGDLEEAVDALARFAADCRLKDLTLEVDERGEAIVDRPFDPPFMELLRTVPGARRDKEDGVWRVPPRGLVPLIDLVARLALPFCSSTGCALDGDPPPSRAHQEAHLSLCLGV